MNKETIIGYFTQSEKLVLGVCSRLSKILNLSPLALRITMIVLTFIFIPLGILAYFVLYMLFSQNKKKVVIFGLLGALLGIPLSYYFQSDIIRNYGGSSGMFGYLKNFTKTVERYDQFVGNGWDIVFNLFLSMVLFAILGGVTGYYLNKKQNK